MTERRELEPCPFCGGSNLVVEMQGTDLEYVLCDDCGGFGPDHDAKVSWSSRTPPPGYAMVPEKPTEEMLQAAIAALSDATIDEPKAAAWDATRAYKAMLTAARAGEG